MTGYDGEASNFYEMIAATHSKHLVESGSADGLTTAALRKMSTDFRSVVLRTYVYCCLAGAAIVPPRKR